MVSVALVACSAGGPSDDERAVCASVQDLVDGVSRREGTAVRRGVGELRAAVSATSNEALAFQGGRFFRVVDAPVGPWDDMTLAEINEVGRQATDESAGALEGLIVTCEELGLPIERLPAPPARS